MDRTSDRGSKSAAERLHLSRLALHDFLGQIVDDVRVAARKRSNEAAPHRHDPASTARPIASPAIQPSVRVSSAAISSADRFRPITRLRKAGGFIGCETQIGGANLGQLAAHAPARQRQRRIRSAGDHQVHLRRQVIEQEGQRGVNGRRFDQVIIVEHQHKPIGERGNIVQQQGQDRFDRRGCGDSSKANALAPRSGRSICKAAMT